MTHAADFKPVTAAKCVVPKWSRSYYDHAVRAVGVKMIEVDTPEELERALSVVTNSFRLGPRGSEWMALIGN